MDKEYSLISTFTEAAKSGWFLESDVQVLKWMEDFAERLKRRANIVTEDVHKLLEQAGGVEQDFYNTFNSFRVLSNTHYIENRVYEEDEMTAPNSELSVPFSEASLPAQGYEEDIVPRYKEALRIGWNAYRQYIQRTSRNTSELIPDKVGWNNGQLPHIIGTEEFMRDNSCGLTDRSLWMDPLDFNSDTERETMHLAAEMDGTRPFLEADWYATDSDKDNQVGMEPAVSAALDFKAMLEAALRSPYIPYNDDIFNVNSTSSDVGKIGNGLVTSEAFTVGDIRNGLPNVPGKNSDVSCGMGIIDKIPEDIQIYNTITTASTSTGTILVDFGPKPIVISQEIPATPIQRNKSSRTLGCMDRLEPSSFSRKLHTGTVSGQHLDSGDELSTSGQNEHVQSISQPVDIYQIDKCAKSNEKPQLAISSESKKLIETPEVKDDIYESGSTSTRKIFNAAELSGWLLQNEEESSSSHLQESDHLLLLTTAVLQTFKGEDIDVKGADKCTRRDRERDINNQKSLDKSSGSSSISRHLQGTLFSGGLFDDEDELIFYSPVESVNDWSQPSVPERLFGTISDSKKEDLMPSSSMSTNLIQAAPNSPDEMIPTNIQVCKECKFQFSPVEETEQTSYSNDHTDKPYSGSRSLKESLFRKGLFDDRDSDEDDDSGNLFMTHSSIGQKNRSHDGALVTDSNVVQGLSNTAITLNILSQTHSSLPEQHKDDELHKIYVESVRGTETTSPTWEIISCISTRFENSGFENGMSDLDDNKEIGPPVNLTEYALGPEKVPSTSTALPLHKTQQLLHFVPAISPHNHLNNDSDSWSRSSSESDIKPNMVIDIKTKASSDSWSEINNEQIEKVVLEAKGFLHLAGNTAFILQDGGFGNLAESVSLLEPNNYDKEYVSKSKSDIGQKDVSLPVSHMEFKNFSADQYLEENRLEATTLTSLSNSLFKAKTSFENWIEVTQPSVENQEAAAMKLVGMDIPKRTCSESGDLHKENLSKNNNSLWHSSEHSELNSKRKDGLTVFAKYVPASEGATRLFINQEDLNNMPLTSTSNKDLKSNVLSGSSVKETKGELINNVLPQSEGLADTQLSSPIREMNVPSRYTSLFGDDDEEMEASLFGPTLKTNPKDTPIHKTPGKHMSLFDNDKD